MEKPKSISELIDEVCPDCNEVDCICYEDDVDDFIPCRHCDGHPACEDFGCAIEMNIPINTFHL